MGFAVAEALAEAGARVLLVAGPVHRATPAGVRRIDVRTAEEMRAAVLDALPADGFVGVAAVADYRPAQPREHKIKRSDEPMTLKLVPNPDILGEVGAASPRPFLVGFAAETERIDEHARAKLARRGLDLVAANRVGDDAGFDTCDNALIVYSAEGRRELGTASKAVLARRLVEVIAEHMEGSAA
jgi:phosphopantothenoylcysteine decarboxylase/phosphopantothenate--cysteine ligase